jgi:predicted 3-demethylubiquinone-9 3-methyltransferase (glyoxalase superfamily)
LPRRAVGGSILVVFPLQEKSMQKITPFLWFDGVAEEAANYYLSVFAGGEIHQVFRWLEDGPNAKKGDVLTVDFEIEGLRFSAINGGPHFKLTPAVSFLIEVKSQAELDGIWDKLLADGGNAMSCGWITDKFGLTWQVCPDTLLGYLNDPDPQKARRSMQAMMSMVKFDFAALKAAHDGA